MDEPQASTGKARQLSAWGVHLFTASGVVLVLLALDAAAEARPREAFAWLFAALAVDGIDGTLARAAKVKERLPRIDGEALDLIIDYLSYVVVPALLMWRMDLFPPGLGVPLAAAILMSSLYVFVRRDMKTDDGYFRGFPALWNIVALYFFVAAPQPVTAAATVAALAVLSFAPVHFVHPFRVRDYGRWLPATAMVWAVSTLALLAAEQGTGLRQWLLALSLATAAILVGLGLVRTVRGPASAGAR